MIVVLTNMIQGLHIRIFQTNFITELVKKYGGAEGKLTPPPQVPTGLIFSTR